MVAMDFEPLTVAVPLREDPPGVFRIGKSRVLLELVLRAFQRGESPEGIVRAFRSLQLAEVYAVVTSYLTNPAPFDAYLRQCNEVADALRRDIEISQGSSVDSSELTARARSKGLIQ
jgi:hypothetical protein